MFKSSEMSSLAADLNNLAADLDNKVDESIQLDLSNADASSNNNTVVLIRGGRRLVYVLRDSLDNSSRGAILAPTPVVETKDEVKEHIPAPIPAVVVEEAILAPTPVVETKDEVKEAIPAPIPAVVVEEAILAPTPVVETKAEVKEHIPAPIPAVVVEEAILAPTPVIETKAEVKEAIPAPTLVVDTKAEVKEYIPAATVYPKTSCYKRPIDPTPLGIVGDRMRAKETSVDANSLFTLERHRVSFHVFKRNPNTPDIMEIDMKLECGYFTSGQVSIPPFSAYEDYDLKSYLKKVESRVKYEWRTYEVGIGYVEYNVTIPVPDKSDQFVKIPVRLLSKNYS